MSNYTADNYRGLPAHFCDRERTLPVGAIRFPDGSVQKSAGGGGSGYKSDVGLFNPKLESPALQKVLLETATFYQVDRLVSCNLRFTGVVKDGKSQHFKVRAIVPQLSSSGFSEHSGFSGQAQVLLAGDQPELQYVSSVKAIVGTAKVELSVLSLQNTPQPSQQSFDVSFTYVL